MKTKMITIPFDLERAKRISRGLGEGKIVTRGGDKARIICWDVNSLRHSIVALVTYNCEEICFMYNINGACFTDGSESAFDLVLQVPDYTQYKDGDILVEKDDECPFIYRKNDKYWSSYYAGITITKELSFSSSNDDHWCPNHRIKGYANEEQKQKFIKVLQNSTEPLAKEYLKRFFGIEKEECEFKPFDPVLVRDKDTDIWTIDTFKIYIPDTNLYYCMTGEWEQCLPYNEDTKHLFNTNTKN